MDDAKKQHRAPRGGKKVKKKAQKVERHNPKAFTFSGGWKSVQKRAQRQAEIAEKREKFTRVIDKTPTSEPPPYIVVVQGPPQCGKSTLIKSLIKHYTKQSVGTLAGPVTCVVSKSRRLTFVECPNDLTGMIDLAKVADLAIIMIDSDNGLEMNTFEFVNIMQNHGFPRILGVLSKLDHFKDNKSLRKFKKNMKNRFWTEIYDGAKLFYLTGIKGKRYLKNEVLNLSRFISVQKYEPLVWRSQRPYFLGLNVEVLNSEGVAQESTVDIAVSGFLRGARLRQGQAVHIPGAGDFQIAKIERQMDPCPLPRAQSSTRDAAKLLRRLKMQEKLIFAPNCDIGQVEVEGSSMFIKLPSNRPHFTPSSQLIDDRPQGEEQANEDDTTASSRRSSVSTWSTDASDSNDSANLADVGGEGQDESQEAEEATPDEKVPEAVSLMRGLQRAEGALDERIRGTRVKLTSKSEHELVEDERKTLESALEDDSDERDAAEVIDFSRLEVDTLKGAFDDIRDRVRQIQMNNTNLFNAIYGIAKDEKLHATEDEDDALIEASSLPVNEDAEDTTRLQREERLKPLRHWTSLISTTGSRGLNILQGDDFAFVEPLLPLIKAIAFITGGWEEGPTEETALPNISSKDFSELEAERFEKRKQFHQQVEKMKGEVVDVLENSDDVPIGSFIRVTIRGVNEEWASYVTTNGLTRPVIIGGVLSGEQSLTFIHTRVKRHRWSPGICKTTEPLLFSVGWRRFQSIPYFAIEERNAVRIRHLKYTPEHMHCLAFFYGHAIPPGTGILAIKHTGEKLADFRISLTGVVIENDPNPRVYKKLKFVGQPSEIKRNTAFVKGMFNSDIEVSRVQGVSIQTQSGIKGVIKKARGYEGEFRAAFEAQIRKNDVVICKAWYKIPMEPFCNPQIDGTNWDRVRTFVEIRRELKLPAVSKHDSEYGPRQQREVKEMRKLRLGAELLKRLPYRTLPKNDQKKTEAEMLVANTLRATKTPYEQMVDSLIRKASSEKKHKQEHKQEKLREKIEAYQKAEKKTAEQREKAKQEVRKRAYVKQGKDQSRARKRLRFE